MQKLFAICSLIVIGRIQFHFVKSFRAAFKIRFTIRPNNLWGYLYLNFLLMKANDLFKKIKIWKYFVKYFVKSQGFGNQNETLKSFWPKNIIHLAYVSIVGFQLKTSRLTGKFLIVVCTIFIYRCAKWKFKMVFDSKSSLRTTPFLFFHPMNRVLCYF